MGAINLFMLNHPTEVKIISTVVLCLAMGFIGSMINHFLHKQMTDVQKFYKVKKGVHYTLFILALILLLEIWGGSIGTFSTYFGLVSAGLAIALKDLVINIAAWFFILARRPFEVGDRIEIDHVAGDVIDQRVFQFTLMEIGNWVHGEQSTGRIIHIPNQQVFIQPLANYTKGFKYIWNEIKVVITFESDWEKAKELLNEIVSAHSAHLSSDAEHKVRDAARKFMIYYNNLTPTVYTSVAADGISLTMRYLCEPRHRRDSEEKIWEAVLSALSQHKDIQLAYQTFRVVQTEATHSKQ